MKLSKEEVLKIAKLASLELKDEEVEKFQVQLSEVLNYIGKLSKLNTSNVEPTSQVTGLKNVFREKDDVGQSRAVALKKGQYFETDAIF